MKEESILINGIRVNYKIAGEGPAILILHGWGGSSDSWVKVQEILALKGLRVICPDLPGFGKSMAPSPSAWGVQDYSNFILKFIKEIGVSQFFLLGHSFGGRIAIKLVQNYPQGIEKLILCASAGIKQKWGKKEKIIFQFSRIGNALFTPTRLKRLKNRARNIFYLFLRHRDYAQADGVMRETIKKVLSEDLLPEFSQIKTKTLLIWGKKDKMVPLKYAYLFKEKIKNSRLEILSQAGHSPNLENPEKLGEVIFNFLNNN